MSASYFTFYFTLTTPQGPVAEETLQTLGSDAWRRLNALMDQWPDRHATVKDHHMDFQVEVLELCEDDVGVEPAPGAPDTLCYGLGFYSEQEGLALTPEHLAHVISLCETALSAAALAAGYVDGSVAMVQATSGQSTERSRKASAATLPELLSVADETYWVAGHGDAPTGLFFDRDKAFATGALYVDAFAADGSPVRAYTCGLDTDEPFTRASYFVEA